MRQEPSRQNAKLTYETRAKLAKCRAILRDKSQVGKMQSYPMRQEPSWQKAKLTYETRAKQAKGRAILKVNDNQAKGKANLIENSDLTEVSPLSEDYFLDPGLYMQETYPQGI